MTVTLQTIPSAFELTEDQIELRDTIREFAESEIAPHAAEWDEHHIFPVEVIRKLGELGAMGVAFPEEYGGLGAGAVAQAVIEVVVEHFAAVLPWFLDRGDEAHRLLRHTLEA